MADTGRRHIERQLELARERLLDLTMRNRLLNYRPTRLKTVHVVDEAPGEVFDILTLQEKTMTFRPNQEIPTPDSHNEENQAELSFESEEEDSVAGESPEFFTPSETGGEIDTRHVGRFLQTDLKSEELKRRLLHISQQAQSVLEEQGYNVLFLALGFLEWFESPSAQQPRLAPLILIPVELERRRVRSAFKLRWTEEDIQSNISLQAKVLEQGVELPEFETSEESGGIGQYFQAVRNAIAGMPTWKVVDDIYLDFFSFTKFVMYKDLDPKTWPEGRSPADHPLIRAILDPHAETDSGTGFSEDEVDVRLRPHDVYHIHS